MAHPPSFLPDATAHGPRGPQPRWVDVDLGALVPGRPIPLEARPWDARERARAEPELGVLGGALGAWSGPALAAVLLEREHRRRPGGRPLVISVGEGVRRGLATAARASVSGRAPLTGLFSEGQVGGDLGRRLAGIADALLIRGRAELGGAAAGSARGAVLLVTATAVELLAWPELSGRAARDAARAIEERFGGAALVVGPAGEAGVPLAGLVASGDPPHFVGRGGLGALLGRMGLKGIAVRADPPRPKPAPAGLARALAASPRLAARAAQGTFELYEVERARGSLRAADAGAPDDRTVERLGREAESLARGRHGCRGCPTPCGWVFEEPTGERSGARPGMHTGARIGARFGATWALGAALGLPRTEDALALLARCDALGVDAKEVGAALALGCAARERGVLPAGPRRGDRASLAAAIDAIAAGRAGGLERGALRAAFELGLSDLVTAAKGAAVRSEVDPLALLVQCASSRGPDPMRGFAFGAAVGERDLARLVAPLPLPPTAGAPGSAAGAGRLAWWHENLALGLDVTGFCAFSAAGLLSDGVCGLDDLARWIAPAALRRAPGFEAAPGAHLLAAGGALALLQRQLDVEWGMPACADRPLWARPVLDRPGVWDEYRRLRELDSEGRPLGRALERLGEALEPDPTGGLEALQAAGPVAQGAPPQGPGEPGSPARAGRVGLRAGGPLGRALGEEFELRTELPAPVGEVLLDLCRQRPELEPLLVHGGRPLPVPFRAGRRLDERALVRDGERIDLVLAIAGG